MIIIDGSVGEGGGQILRTSLSLSVLLKIPVKIVNIRKNRGKPGLRPQHLTVVKTLQMISDANVRGASVGSQTLEFIPRTLKSVSLSVNVGTAGSVTLILQAILLPLLFASDMSRIKVIGGTDVPWSPTLDYLRKVFGYFLQLIGVRSDITLLRRGFIPKGEGKVVLTVYPVREEFEPLSFTRFTEGEVWGNVVCGKLPCKICESEAKILEDLISSSIERECVSDVASSGNSITLWKEGSLYGASNVHMSGSYELFVKETADQFLRYKKYPVDPHMADQVVNYLSLTKGTSKLLIPEVTAHLTTNLRIIRKFIPINYTIEGRKEGYMLTIEGVLPETLKERLEL